MNEPWSKEHKRVFRGARYSNLSNSYAEPLTMKDLLAFCKENNNDNNDNVVRAYQQDHSLEYTPNGGSADLRKAIATQYYKDSPNITADDILVFPGAQVALQTAAFAFCNTTNSSSCSSGSSSSCCCDHAIVFVPGYQSTIEAPLQAGGCASITKIRLRYKHGWSIDPRDVRNAIQPGKTKYMVLNQPYNPAGTLISRPVFDQLVDIAREFDLVVLCDEVYRLLEHCDNDNDNNDGINNTNRLPPIAQVYEKGISCVTLSKPFGACGVTIGWLALHNNNNNNSSLKQRLVDVQYFNTACPSRASELQAMMVLQCCDAILERNLRIIKHNKSLLEDFITNKHPELFEWVRPTAGAIAFVKFKQGRRLSLNTAQLGKLMMQEEGLSMKPFYCFTDSSSSSSNDDNDDDLDCFFRVGYGESKMPQALEVFDRFVQRHKQEWLDNTKEREE